MGASEGEERSLRHISMVMQRRKKHTQKREALFGLGVPGQLNHNSVYRGETDCPDKTMPARSEEP
jgi:hypothetical protein